MIEAKHIYSLTDFLRNYKAHIANLKETKAPELLTINGRAEVVVIDAESYEKLIGRLRHSEAVAVVRADFVRLRSAASPEEPLSPEELERRNQVVDDIMTETERLGLYK